MAFKKLSLTKEMYSEAKKKGLTFAQFLQTQDDSESDKLDAYERQLAAYGLRVKGKQVSLVEDFYATSSGSALFPEFINRQVLIGMEMGRNECMLSDLVANVRTINSVSYKGLSAAAQSGEKGAFRVGETGKFPLTKITYNENSINIYKFGHAIDMSYEVIRRCPVDQLAVHLQVVGRNLRRSLVAEAIDVIINGDGNSNAAAVHSATGISYDNIIDFDAEFDTFAPTVWVTTKIGMTSILKLAEFKDPQAGFNYQQTGKMISPLGITMRRDSTIPVSTLVGVDRSAAIEQILEAGSQLTEADKIIDQQLNKVVISQVGGFAKIYKDASMVWDWS